MIPGLGKRQMEKMMKQMGIQAEEIDASEVVIKTREKEIVISEPQVTKIKMSGQDTFQIMGKISKRTKERFSKDDVKMIMEQTGASEEEAKKTLEEEGDMAAAIMKLKK